MVFCRFFFVIVINTQIDPHIFKGHEYEHNNNCKIAPPPAHPHVQVSYKYTTYLAHPINFFALPILQKLRLFQVWFLFGATLGWILISAILEQSINNKMVSKV